jgi:uncharacterized sporulation protein YeaH/YhbH (DUF444 family)
MRINHGGQPVKGESRTDPRLQVLLQLARNLGRDPGDPVVQRELAPPARPDASRPRFQPAGFYDYNDLAHLQALKPLLPSPLLQLQTMDELLARDKQREKDGFPRRIRIGRLIRPGEGGDQQIVVVPTTVEPKLYHDDSVTEEGEGQAGGSGDGQEGEVIGEEPVNPREGEGEGTGAGQGKGAGHEVIADAFDLGRVLTEQFSLPNLQNKGRKRAFSKYRYDLTDRHRGFGQVLDKKATMREIVRTNIMLGRINGRDPIATEELLFIPRDRIYRILSKEKDYETQALVFFVRDYSGSMQGDPTRVIATQHLSIYSWLVYQYQHNVKTRFILHDTEAKEVPDFHTYYNSQVAGGTNIAPAYQLVNHIVAEEHLERDYNIYVFHGTDGDDWDADGKEAVKELLAMLKYTARVGVTVARNAWTRDSETAVEKYLKKSGLLKEKPDLFRLDALVANDAPEPRIIESIRRLIS